MPGPWILALLLSLQATLTAGESPFQKHTNPSCHPDCTKSGNCNGDTGQCDCAFGYEGPACDMRTMPACHTSHAGPTPPHYGTWTLKNCNCFRQLAKIGCPTVGDRECLYDMLWNRTMACFEQDGVPEDEQTSDIPDEGFGAKGLTWYWGQPMLGREAMNVTAPPRERLFEFQPAYQLPLSRCEKRCNERGLCGGASPGAARGNCTCLAGYGGPACELVNQEMCYLSCAPPGAPAGTCSQGFCHCPPGRWGLGCTRDTYYTSTKGWLPSHAAMRIFVYTLPQNLVHMKTDDGLFRQDPMYLAEQSTLGELLALGAADPEGAGAVVTQNPWEANLFWVPTHSFFYTGNVVTPVRMFRHVIDWLRRPSPHLPFSFWEASGGRNHIMWAVNDRGYCDWHHLEPALKHPIMMVHFGQAPRMPMIHPMTWDGEDAKKALDGHKQALLAGEKQPWFRGFRTFPHFDTYYENMPCFRPEKDVVVTPALPKQFAPFLDVAYGRDHDSYNITTQRHITLFFAGGTRDDQMYYSQGVRQAVLDWVSQDKPLWTDPDKAGQSGGAAAAVRIEGWRRPDYVIGSAGLNQARMLEAKFCLAPSGWGWGIRVVTAVALGCIPVIVQDHVYQAYWDVLPYDEFSIRVSRRQLHRLPDILDTVTPQQLEALQRGLVTWHKSFLYKRHTPHSTALNATLASLRRRLNSLWSANWRRRRRY